MVLCVHYLPKRGLQYRALCGTVCIIYLSVACSIGPSVLLCVHYLPKPGLQSRALCATVCALSIVYDGLLVLFILYLCVFFNFII